jgi:hypothetical protein
MKRRWWLGCLVVGLLGSAGAGASDDDLAVVKKAVGSQGASARWRAPPPASRKAGEPRWLKLRIEERGDKRSRVSINLPLEFVKSLATEGEDWPLDWSRDRHAKSGSIRLGDVLRALDSGQDLVQIEDEEGTVRIWIE